MMRDPYVFWALCVLWYTTQLALLAWTQAPLIPIHPVPSMWVACPQSDQRVLHSMFPLLRTKSHPTHHELSGNVGPSRRLWPWCAEPPLMCAPPPPL